MYTDMKMWTDIRRRVLVENQSKRSILRHYGIHFQTLEKILTHPEPPGYRRTQARPKPKIGSYLPVIDEILRADQQVHRKQRHTAKRIYERLRDEYGYTGGYTIVKDAVRKYKRSHREVFVPLIHPPGHAQSDFGRAWIYVAGKLTQAALFVMTLVYSDAIFMCVFPRECTETFQEGHKRAFEFFGGVPRCIRYDNTKIAVAKIVGGRGRETTREFQRLQSHYLFAEQFCRVRQPNEKGHVENLLGYARRNFLVPIPRVEGFEDINTQLLKRCTKDLDRQLRGKPQTKAELLEEERDLLLPLPKQRFEARRVVQAHVNSLQLVRFDRNDYSVPTEYAHHPVTAVGGIDEVRFIVGGHRVARHRRCWEKERVFFDPVHYLALLERKPGALDFARPLESWSLPDCFTTLRRRLEADMGGQGTQEYIKILRLLESVTPAQLTDAVTYALTIGATSSDAVRLIVEHRGDEPVGLFCLDGRPHLKAVQIGPVDLGAYAELITDPGGQG
ncbi:IS21 family transposase [Thermodesulfobacteriota bacterium]